MMSAVVRAFRSAVVVLVAGAALGAAPQDPQPPPVFRSGVALVPVDVVVLDRDRQPVRDLTAADFTIVEDGVPQSIRTFSAVSVADPDPTLAAWVRDVSPDVRSNDVTRDRRMTAIVLDDAQTRVQLTANVKAIGRRLVEQLGPDDLGAVIFTRNNKAAQEFTGDRARLLAAVNAFSGEFAPSLDDGRTTALGDIGFGRTPFGRAGGDQSPMHWYRTSVGVLRRLTERLGEVPERRKAVIYVSPGVPVDRGGGGEMRAIAADMENLFRDAQRASVAVYCIDSSGLGGLAGERAEDLGPFDLTARPDTLLQEFLQTVAENTGGLAIINRNEFASGVTQIFRENGSYYLIGYESTNTKTDGKFRALTVRVNRPDVTVRVRRGYYGPKLEKPTKSPMTTDLQKAVAGLLPMPDLRISAHGAAFAIPGKGENAVALVFGVTQKRGAEEVRVVETLNVTISAFDPEGSYKKGLRETYRLTVRPTAEGEETHFELLSRVDLKPGRYQLRLAAHSARENKTGGLYYDLDVPDYAKAPLSLSAVALVLSPAGGAPKDRFAGVLPVIPTALRGFERTDRVSAFARVYQGGKRPIARVDLTARVVDAKGAEVFTAAQTLGAEQFGAVRGADYRIDLPLAQLSTGRYLLTVDAKAWGGTSAHHDVKFLVVSR